jgi:hypothetical protein
MHNSTPKKREKIPNEINLFDEIIPLGVPEDVDGMDAAEGEEAPSDDEFYTVNYNTDLSPKAEEKFQAWLKGQSKDKGKDMSKDLIDYDLRGFWKAGAHAEEKSGHGPDTYKKPNHPTFSDESKYSGMIAPHGGNYMGGKWDKDDDNNDTFTPSKHMMANTHKADMLKKYMAEREPNTILILPTEDVKEEEGEEMKEMEMDNDDMPMPMPKGKHKMKVPVTQITIVGKPKPVKNDMY